MENLLLNKIMDRLQLTPRTTMKEDEWKLLMEVERQLFERMKEIQLQKTSLSTSSMRPASQE